ncbi:MAG: prepilin-type N-terminal cleavage/methylation domain-containing protein [Clostridiales bacterium]|jgi:type II secretory pathway component PulJ|nr:prepilin-type N-terminal cleavage/methylation domain-containing protein [Clostridiales bacterium]MBR6255289.1 prepilin-type N-terminal cleavage/methylation domain-containing protein [Clostridiales bacterium]MCR5275159.1 prepilin-type N-terminal cleavage/methylation domain-containing protein [Clostridiales bacterium]
MIRVNKNKKNRRIGFTLLEMVLVIAIMMMMSFYIFSTFKTVNYSHLKVAVVNDMHDYASLTLKAIQNHLCNATSISKGSTIKLDDNSEYVLINNTNALPGFTQYHSGNGSAKWGLKLKITTNPSSKTVRVVLEMTDKAYPSSGIAYTDEVVVYCPACTADTIAPLTDAESCKFSLTPVTT